MEQSIYYSKSIREGSPMFSLGIAKIIGGTILMFYSFSAFFKIEALIEGLANNESDRIVTIIPEVTIGIFLFLISISFVLKGIRNIKKITLTPNDPLEFKNYNKVIESIISGKLEIYKLPAVGPIKFAYNYISDKIPFLKPAQRRVVEMNISFLRKYIFLLVVIFLSYYLQRFIPEQIYTELSIPNNFIVIPYTFLVLLFAFLVLSFATIFLLIPEDLPRQEVKEEIASIRGGGDPNQFCSLLEKAFYQFRFNKLPNRAHKFGFEKNEELSFSDTGSFQGRLIMETHPKYLNSMNQGIANFIYIGIALVSLVVSLIYFNNITIIRDNPGSLIAGVFHFLAGIIYFRTSINFYKRTSLLLSRFNFESFLVYIEIEGTIGKTEITAGKAITDSIETKNIVIRSDSQLKVYAAKVQTENHNVSDSRYITAMISDDSVDEVLHVIINQINNFKDEGVSVRGIDITSDSISQITQANLKIQGAKRSIRDDNLLKGAEIKAIGKSVEQPEPDANIIDSQTKECPKCAEIIKAKAVICRYCRHEFS